MSLSTDFVGRAEDLGRIESWFRAVAESGTGQMVAVRGRRQVGKSTLYTEFLRRSGAPHVFFTGIHGGDVRVQLDEFRACALEADPPLPEAATLFAGPARSWRDVFGRVQLAAREGPVVVVLDEFPWATQNDPTLEGVLQVAWDRELSRLPVLLVLIGSDVVMMEQLTEYGRPLYGRVRESVIGTLTPAEVSTALGWAAATSFDGYLVTGGYPRLVAEAARFRNPTSFVRSGVEDDTSILVSLGQRAIDAEFPPDAQARHVLATIGAEEVGLPTFSTVVGRLGDDEGSSRTAVTRALKLLGERKRLVAIDTPAGSSTNTKLRRYRITDPYLRFWFRFVGPQLANITRGRADLAVSEFDAGWESWRGKAIEPVVRDAIHRLAPELGMGDVADVAGWWDRQSTAEVDIVASTTRRVVAVGSVKWRTRKKFGAADLAALDAARAVAPHAVDATMIGVSAAGFTPKLDLDVRLGAEDLLAAWG